ncbi:MAG: trypsin-like peptidase domain-containing protein [Bacilli bacterium]|nr:trypsin-like peptidase domain-containing protein [Bacilli bacterium]
MKTLEQLYYCTTRILAHRADVESIGTAFFLELKIDGKTYPLLVTNKHVLFDEQVCDYQIEIHTSLTKNKKIFVRNGRWFFHPEEDLAFAFIRPILHQALSSKEANKSIFLTEQNIIGSKDIEVLDAIEEVIMIGYPKGIYDEYNNLPVVRKGILSSPLHSLFNGKRQGLIDVALFPGSSGSPVFVFRNYVGNDLNLKNDYIRLIGVNFQGYTYQNEVIKAVNGGDSVTTFVNLAMYIKAECLLDFKKVIANLNGPLKIKETQE